MIIYNFVINYQISINTSVFIDKLRLRRAGFAGAEYGFAISALRTVVRVIDALASTIIIIFVYKNNNMFIKNINKKKYKFKK